MCSSRSRRVKCVTSPSAATAPVTSLVTTRKRSSPWWRPTTTSSVESPLNPPINQSTGHSSASIRGSGIGCSPWPALPQLGRLQRVAFRSYFLPVVSARQTDEQLQRACDLLLRRPWREIATSNTDCRHERGKQTTQASTAVPYTKCYSLTDCLSPLLLCIWGIICCSLSKGGSVLPFPLRVFLIIYCILYIVLCLLLFFYYCLVRENVLFLWRFQSLLSAGSLPSHHFIACMVFSEEATRQS